MASSSSCLAVAQHPVPLLLRCLPFPAPLGRVHKILAWDRRSSRHRRPPISRRDGFLAAYRAGSWGLPSTRPVGRWERKRTAESWGSVLLVILPPMGDRNRSRHVRGHRDRRPFRPPLPPPDHGTDIPWSAALSPLSWPLYPGCDSLRPISRSDICIRLKSPFDRLGYDQVDLCIYRYTFFVETEFFSVF
jgi:hypothetical protein